jgi:hypothetical protein
VSGGDLALPLLGGVDPHGETRLGAGQMEPHIGQIALLLTQATSGAEYRGLVRLHTMALHCAQEQGELLFIGNCERRWITIQPRHDARLAAREGVVGWLL